jgi:hypothetical protein
MNTFSDVLARHNVDIPEHLIADAEVPVISDRIQAQGDLLIIPMRTGKIAGLVPVPTEGVAVVVGENGGNTHWLSADGPVTYKLDTSSSAEVASVEVGEGATAFVIHTDEHGANAMGPGQYTIRRQQEQADAIRLVRD